MRPMCACRTGGRERGGPALLCTTVSLYQYQSLLPAELVHTPRVKSTSRIYVHFQCSITLSVPASKGEILPVKKLSHSYSKILKSYSGF
jgi:hypothetical protein